MAPMNVDRVKLMSMAVITSPLMALYNVAPMSFFLSSGVMNSELAEFYQVFNPFGIWLPIVFITFNALIIWSFNIWLVEQAKKSNLSPGGRYFVSFVLTFILVFIIIALSAHVRPASNHFGNLRLYPFVGLGANNAFVLILIELILNRERRAALELEKARLQATNFRARHELLKKQIQPHFLFNSLNTLKLLIKRDQYMAESFTIRLSNFLRASISDGRQELLSLAQELAIFNNFIELQQVRFANAIHVFCDISPVALTSCFLPSFTLQTLGENAIKHNEFNCQKPLRIEIRESGDHLYFSNNALPIRQGVESTGIGLKNLDERFEMLSGKGIEIFSTERKFVVRFQMMDSRT